RAVAYPGQNAQAEHTFAGGRGYVDSILEGQVIPAPAEGQTLTAPAILQESVHQGIPVALVNATNVTSLQGFDLPAEAIARIVTAVQNGTTVIVPTRSILLTGTQTTAWLEINPMTGEIIGVMQHGGHAALVEYQLGGYEVRTRTGQTQVFV